MVLIGLLMALGAAFKTEFILYRLLAARADACWGEKKHTFLLASGVMVMLFGGLIALGIVPVGRHEKRG